MFSEKILLGSNVTHLFDSSYPAIVRKKCPKSTLRMSLNMFSEKILLGSNVTHLLKNEFQKMCIIGG